MTSNATLYFESLREYKDIQELIGTQENLFVDFKETRGIYGKMHEDDKKNFSKAASGFAHQEGGVIVWGIEARKDKAIGCIIESESDVDCCELKKTCRRGLWGSRSQLRINLY